MGKFIAIDGLDGSGKGTQTDILVERLKKENKKVRVLSFPMYENDSSLFARMYLDGKFGKIPRIQTHTPPQCSLLRTGI